MLNTSNTGGLKAPFLVSEKTMDVVITRGTVAGGERREVGDVVTVTEQEARLLVASGKAEEHKPKPKPKGRKTKAIESSELETRDVS